MGVGVQGEAGGEVAQHTGDGFDVYAVLQCDGGEGVAEVMEPNFRDTCPLEDALEHIIHAVRGDGAAIWRREHIGVVGFRFLHFQNFYRLG